MVFDFATRPPEITSALMYSGPGAGPMMAAATNWNNLAAELSTAAASHESAISELTESWSGPAAAAMAAAAMPYIQWLSTSAAAAEHAATQAAASAAAYQTAFGMTVPPALIAANRAQLAVLTATNFLGQNTPAIAATEVQYAEMWAQDAAAMYGYAGTSASAATLNPLAPPAATTNPGGAAAQTSAVSTAGSQSQLSNLVANLPSAMQSLASPTAATGSNGGLFGTGDGIFTSSGGDGFLNDLVSSGGNIGAYNYAGAAVGFGGSGITGALGLQAAANSAASASAGASASAAAVTAPAGAGGVLAGSAAASAPPVSAGLAQASTVGKLSVPSSWSSAVPDAGRAGTFHGADWHPDFGAGESGPVTNVATGMPAVASSGRGGGLGLSTPRYGIKPTVMPTRLLV